MFSRTILGSAVLLALCIGGPAAAGPGDGSYMVAQAADPRVSSLEEQLRQLNGRVEELNFQILQMQDQLRRMQEDSEFRFQELEGKRSDAGSTAGTAERPRAVAEPPETPATSGSGETVIAQPDETPQTGELPRTIGTIVFDAEGNVVGGAEDDSNGGLASGGSTGSDGTVVAALPATDNPEKLYRTAYEFILSGDYQTAEAGFRRHVERYPADPRTSDAHFWLGEALLGQDRYREAAEVFLRANRDFPEATKAPDMLLKLGVSLAAMNQRDVACATYDEIGQRYPQASAALQERVKQEQALAGC